jgi:hypothetical protein
VKRFLNLYFILILGAALRILFAFHSLGFEHPNENYRLLEPLAALQGYSTRLPWEWTEGLLSKIPVFFHYFYLLELEKFGVTTALGQLIALRLLYGMLSLFQIWAAWRITLRTSNSRTSASISALIVAIWPEIVFRSVRLMDYSLEASLLAIAMILVFTTHRRHREIYIAVAGVVLGGLFFVRFQSGMYFIAIVGVLLFLKPRRFWEAVNLTAFYGLTIAFFAVIEAQGFRHLLVPYIKYVQFNVLQNGASTYYGTEPWHRYFSELAKNFGFLPVIVFAYAFARMKLDLKIAAVFIFPFLVLSLVAHKEARFIYGFAWLMIPLTIVGVEHLKQSKQMIALAVLCLLVGFGINTDRILQRYTEGSEVVREWSDVGEQLSNDPSSKLVPLYVYGDPDFLPGGFFLRFTGPLCYKNGDLREGMCLKSVNEFRTFRQRYADGELADPEKPSDRKITWVLSGLQTASVL